MNTKVTLIAMAIVMGLAGVLAYLLSSGMDTTPDPGIAGVGVVSVLLACLIGVDTMRRLRPDTRLPAELRGAVASRHWRRNVVSLDLSDGRRIRCVVARPGGYVVKGKTNPSFHASDAVAVTRATEADFIAEWEHQAGRI